MSTVPRHVRLVLVEDADAYAALVSALLAAEPVPPEVVRFARLDEALRHLAHASRRASARRRSPSSPPTRSWSTSCAHRASNYAQGFHIGPPRPLPDVLGLARAA